jgi:hypothetical protein
MGGMPTLWLLLVEKVDKMWLPEDNGDAWNPHVKYGGIDKPVNSALLRMQLKSRSSFMEDPNWPLFASLAILLGFVLMYFLV